MSKFSPPNSLGGANAVEADPRRESGPTAPEARRSPGLTASIRSSDSGTAIAPPSFKLPSIACRAITLLVAELVASPIDGVNEVLERVRPSGTPADLVAETASPGIPGNPGGPLAGLLI